jgi:hypothetical protein
MQRPLSPFALAFRLALLILLALFLGAVSAVGTRAQLVTPTTVPVFKDEQFTNSRAAAAYGVRRVVEREARGVRRGERNGGSV